MTLPRARLAPDTQSTQEFQRLLPKPQGKRVDRERRPHMPNSHCSQQPEEARFTLHCQRRTAPPDPRQTSQLCETPRSRRGRAPTDPPPQSIQDEVRGCQAPDRFNHNRHLQQPPSAQASCCRRRCPTSIMRWSCCKLQSPYRASTSLRQ